MTEALMSSLPKDYSTWSKAQVKTWLEEMKKIHEVEETEDLSGLEVNGQGLKGLTLENFEKRSPKYGAIFYNTLHPPPNQGSSNTSGFYKARQKGSIGQFQIDKTTKFGKANSL
eukprot:TRINITY_DN69_c0_g1_i18.p1 TRINITY_DN69_c0_g1~~TRINITY_DN69_c0_g1_i18.p1  ORF type:complete len:114 (+),score=19.00 TRINITY_DN69_c0_g1_i18:277-618(+)